MKSFKGLNGTIYLNASGVSIVRDTSISTTFHKLSEVEIPYANISKVNLVHGAALNGYISIVEHGYGSPSSIFSALKDENTVIFRFTKNLSAEKMKRLIEANL